MMTERKTLQLRDDSVNVAPPQLKKKGRGWEISDKRLDALHERAREFRRNPTDAHTVLAEKFANADMGRYKFTRHAVVGSAIVDFNCHHLGMAIAIQDGEEPDAIETRRDKSLEAVGIRVMRIKASDIMNDIDAVLGRITAGMRLRISDKKHARREHQSRSAPSSRSHRTKHA